MRSKGDRLRGEILIVDIAGKDIELQYDKDTEVTFSYETDAKRGNLCFSLYERQGEGISELKEICESKKVLLQLR